MPYKDKNDPRAKEARRRHYQKNKAAYRARTKSNLDNLTRILREAKDAPCQDCNISYPYYVMDFDHRPDETKLYNIAALPRQGSERRLREEIAKCDIVCSNCHRIRTHTRS